MKIGIQLDEALQLIEQTISPLPVKTMPLSRALFYVLAQDVQATIDQPPFPRSPLDGYALRAEDSTNAAETSPVTLEVIDKIYAGGFSNATVQKGQAVRLMTGAMIPHGADCVIRQEDTDQGKTTVAIRKALRPFENYCFQGEDFKKGATLVSKGEKITAAVLGVLAGTGCGETAQVTVFDRPSIALFCTGDEIVPPDGKPLAKGKIYNANAALLKGRLMELGFQTDCQMLEDDAEKAAQKIKNALQNHDFVITTGGVSVGEKDILHQVLPLLDAERVFWKAGFKPGGMAMFSLVDGKPVLSLSGNPFAAAASFELLGRKTLSCLCSDPALLPERMQAVLETDFPKRSPGHRFVRGTYQKGKVRLPNQHDSGVIRSMIGCNCLVEIQAGTPPLPAGATVEILLL